MRDDQHAFEFESGPRGGSQFPAVLLALAAIIAILLVNSTVMAPAAAASAQAAPAASSVKTAPCGIAPPGALRT